MIHLKRNDKIILIIAVAIIVIAAIGIAAYQPGEEPDTDTENGEITEYIVDWEDQTGSLGTESGYAGKSAPYENTISINQGNLKSISFNLTWIDDKAFLGRLGRDTLTLEITTPDGDISTDAGQSMAKSKLGNAQVTIPSINTKPSTDIIEAKDLTEAEQLLYEEPYYSNKWENEDFTIRVYCSVGEILGRFRPRDKGNAFDLEITYEYYEPVLQEEMTETGSNNDSFEDMIEEDYIPPYISMIYTGGYNGRYF